MAFLKKEIVRQVLQRDPIARDDDRRLTAEIWRAELRRRGVYINAELQMFFQLYETGKLSHPESLMRSRRQLQEQDESLRGRLYAKRHEHQDNVRQELGYQPRLFK